MTREKKFHYASNHEHSWFSVSWKLACYSFRRPHTIGDKALVRKRRSPVVLLVSDQDVMITNHGTQGLWMLRPNSKQKPMPVSLGLWGKHYQSRSCIQNRFFSSYCNHTCFGWMLYYRSQITHVLMQKILKASLTDLCLTLWFLRWKYTLLMQLVKHIAEGFANISPRGLIYYSSEYSLIAFYGHKPI